MTEDEPRLFKHPEPDWLGQKFEATWICVACDATFDYDGLREDGHAHKDPPKFCPNCGAEAEDWPKWPKAFLTLPEAARTVNMAVEARLPETWVDAWRVPYERTPLTTRELEAMLNTDTRLDLWYEAARELLERRKTDDEVRFKFAELGRGNVACNRGADLLAHRSTAQGAGTTKVLLAVVEGLLAQVDHAVGLATRLLETAAPSPLTVRKFPDTILNAAYGAEPPTGTVEGIQHMVANWEPTAAPYTGIMRTFEIDPSMPTIYRAAEPGGTQLWRAWSGPCSVCGDTTPMACSDCAIDHDGRVVRVCAKGACQRAHERTHKADKEEEA